MYISLPSVLRSTLFPLPLLNKMAIFTIFSVELVIPKKFLKPPVMVYFHLLALICGAFAATLVLAQVNFEYFQSLEEVLEVVMQPMCTYTSVMGV